MSKKSFKRFFEEITSGDIATVDNKLNLVKRPKKLQKHLQKGKKCKKHGRLNCQECKDAKIIEHTKKGKYV